MLPTARQLLKTILQKPRGYILKGKLLGPQANFGSQSFSHISNAVRRNIRNGTSNVLSNECSQTKAQAVKFMGSMALYAANPWTRWSSCDGRLPSTSFPQHSSHTLTKSSTWRQFASTFPHICWVYVRRFFIGGWSICFLTSCGTLLLGPFCYCSLANLNRMMLSIEAVVLAVFTTFIEVQADPSPCDTEDSTAPTSFTWTDIALAAVTCFSVSTIC